MIAQFKLGFEIPFDKYLTLARYDIERQTDPSLVAKILGLDNDQTRVFIEKITAYRAKVESSGNTEFGNQTQDGGEKLSSLACMYHLGLISGHAVFAWENLFKVNDVFERNDPTKSLGSGKLRGVGNKIRKEFDNIIDGVAASAAVVQLPAENIQSAKDTAIEILTSAGYRGRIIKRLFTDAGVRATQVQIKSAEAVLRANGMTPSVVKQLLPDLAAG